jgi:hypothetical protein
MLVSISFAVETLTEIIFLIASDHATYLFSGRQIRSLRKLMSHPRMIFCSSRSASDFNLFLASIISQGIGLFSCSRREHVSKASRGARLHRTMLSVPSTSTAKEMRLSMKTPVVPRRSMSILTIRSRPFANGIKSSKNFLGGDKMLINSEQHRRVPIVVVLDCGHEIADRF